MDSGPSTHIHDELQTVSTSSVGQAVETVGESRTEPTIDPCRDAGVGSSSAIMALGNDSDESMPSLGTISDDESPVSATHPRGSLRGGSRPTSRNSPFRSATGGPSSLDRDGYSSDGSLPSMQTVSESSDDGLEGSTWGSDDDEEDESDDQEGDEPRRRSPTLPVPQRERPRRRFPDEPEEDDDWIDEPENPFAGFLDLISNNTALGTALDNAAEALGLSRAELPPLPVTDSQRHLSPAALLQAIAQQMRMAFDPHNQPPEQHVDTHRAEVILKALEEVPTTLVSRYEQIRKGSDEDNDEGCAICRDTYILEPDDPSLQPSETELLLDELPFRLSKMRPERILAFPCQGMHLFHAGCLGPWLSRKTTCPTCRFDIDPDSLTLRGQRDPISGRSLSKLWAPPPGRKFVKWLQKEEIRRGHTHHDYSDPSTEPLPIPSHSDREEVDEEGYYAGSDSEDEEWNSGRNESPLELIGNPFFSTDLGSMPPNVAQSMLAALSMSAEPAMGNEYDDEDDYPDHPEMAFAMDYDEAAALSMLVPPSQQPVQNGEADDEDSDSTDVDMPPLAEVSDDEDASQSLESDSEEEEEEEEEDEPAPRRPFVERAGRASLNLERDTFDAIMRDNPEMFRGLPGGPPAADEPNPSPPETNIPPSVVPSTSGTPSTASLPGPFAPSLPSPSAPSLPSPPPATENRLTSLGTGRLLSPLDLMRRTATTSPAQSPIPGPSGTIQVQSVPTEEPVVAHSPSPLRAIFRNFTLWQSPRPSPPPESSLDHVD